MKDKFAYFVATCGPFGKILFAPGTFGSLVALLFVWLFQGSLALYLLLTVISIVLGVWASETVSRKEHLHDPTYIVIDEFCGILVSFFLIPIHFKSLVIGFILFRLFDILKPPPVRLFERLPGGYGIVADDLAAAVYVNLILQILTRYASV